MRHMMDDLSGLDPTFIRSQTCLKPNILFQKQFVQVAHFYLYEISYQQDVMLGVSSQWAREFIGR